MKRAVRDLRAEGWGYSFSFPEPFGVCYLGVSLNREEDDRGFEAFSHAQLEVQDRDDNVDWVDGSEPGVIENVGFEIVAVDSQPPRNPRPGPANLKSGGWSGRTAGPSREFYTGLSCRLRWRRVPAALRDCAPQPASPQPFPLTKEPVPLPFLPILELSGAVPG